MQTTAVVAAALLLLLSAFPRLGSATAAAADTNTNTNQTTSGGNGTGCAPARCGGLTITYPFSLVGAHPIYCGFPAFQLTCDAAANRTYLSRTFRDRLYRVLHIFYGNSSLVMAVEATFAGDGGCRVPDFNVSASLALLPVDISAANRNLTFAATAAAGVRQHYYGGVHLRRRRHRAARFDELQQRERAGALDRARNGAGSSSELLGADRGRVPAGVAAEVDGGMRRVQGARRGVQIPRYFVPVHLPRRETLPTLSR
jgi:hypothetical protein